MKTHVVLACLVVLFLIAGLCWISVAVATRQDLG